MNLAGSKLAMIASAISVSACIAEASLVTMTFDFEVMSNTSSISVNGQEIQQFDTIQYSMVLDTTATSTTQGSTTSYSGGVFVGGGVFYNGVQIASHTGSSGTVSVTNDQGGQNNDEWATQADFANVVGPTLTADLGNGTQDLTGFSPSLIEMQIAAAAASLNLVNSTDLSGSGTDLGALLSDQLDALADEDRSFEMSWSGTSGNGNNGNNGNAGGNGKGKGKGIGNGNSGNGNNGNGGGNGGGGPTLSGRITGVTVTVVPEPGTCAIMAVFLSGAAFWMRRRKTVQRAAAETS